MLLQKFANWALALIVWAAGSWLSHAVADEGTFGPRTESVQAADYAKIVYVSLDGGKEATGTRESPMSSVSGAVASISDARPDHRYAIFVAQGRYVEQRLAMKPHVDLFGGFDKADWSRDIFAHRTILDAQQGGPVVLAADAARLDGFVITGGRHDGHGGGIICDRTTTTLSNNFITGNETVKPSWFEQGVYYPTLADGGGLALREGGSTVRNNFIYANHTALGNGGGIWVYDANCARIIDNVICNNRTGRQDVLGKMGSRSSSGGGIGVSGIGTEENCTPQIIHNVITLNEAGGNSDGGGIFMQYGVTGVIRGNKIVGNRGTDDGGGMYLMTISEPLVEENLIAGNVAGGSGGIRLSKQGRMKARRNVIVANTGGVHSVNSWMVLEDNVIADNQGLGVSHRNYFEHLMPPVIRGNRIYGNELAQTKIELKDFDPAKENTTEAKPSAEDNDIRGKVKQIQYESDQVVTIVELEGADLKDKDLAGRAIQVGNQWSVVRLNEGNRLEIWGNLEGKNGDQVLILDNDRFKN